MIPTSFDESNIVYSKPENMSVNECEALSAFNGYAKGGGPVTITCWKLTKEEVDTLLKTGRVWSIVAGHNLMPQHLQINTPFE
jgi:hypothetical protein